MSTSGHNAQQATLHRWTVLAVCLFLIAIVWGVFGQTLKHDFVNYDDDKYILSRPETTNGLTRQGIIWAFTHSHESSNWNPLTSISHMLDCQVYGLKAGGHHLTNILLHTVSVLLLFLLLRRMTGSLWRSAFVAGLFAVHPLHVESVAWISERKDVLSGVFFMLTLAAYLHYVRRPSPGRYVAVAFLFACGLLSKPMLVTVPFVLLLLDYWPLGRFAAVEINAEVARNPEAPNEVGREIHVQSVEISVDNVSAAPAGSQPIYRLILEKIPLLFLAVGSCFLTLLEQQVAMNSMEALSLPLRISNALVSYVTYLWQMIWPANLAVFYPHLYEQVPVWHVAGAITVLLSVSVLAFALRKSRPYLVTGWLWYLSMSLPIIGIIQVGSQAHADRYTYLPHIGLYLIVAWGAVDLVAQWRKRGQVLRRAGLILILALAWEAWRQTAYWRDSKSLWTHTLAVTSDNYVAHNNLGLALQASGQLDDAIFHYQKAVQTNPGVARHNVGIALAHNNLGYALVQKGLLGDAIFHFKRALALSPDFANAYYNLGNALLQTGDIDDAIVQWHKTLAIRPDDTEARTNLGNALLTKGDLREAILHYAKVLEIAPNSVWALNDLAWIRATASDPSLRDGAEAIELAQRALRLSREENPTFLRTLAAAYGEAGRFSEAIETAHRASDLALRNDDAALARQLGRDVDLYQTNSALRETPRTNGQP
jgi:tetratricopeptide (TPR) repeat protein